MLQVSAAILDRHETRRAELAADAVKALAWGIRALEREGQPVTLPGGLGRVVWRLLQDASDTLARLPDRERVWLLSAERACWPEVWRSAQERFENAVHQLADLKLSKEDTPLPRLTISDPSAIPRMLTVLDWLQHVRARTPNRAKRDKLVVLAMAQGQSMQRVRRLMLGDRGDSAARMVKIKVLSQISTALKSSCKLTGIASNCVNLTT